MMSLLVLALAAAPPPVAAAPVDQEIEVIGDRLREWRGRWRLRGGAVTCKTTRSTRDRAIDAIGCDALVQCIAPITPQWAALEEAKLPRAELQTRANALLEEAKIGDCVFEKREAGIAALAAARKGKS